MGNLAQILQILLIILGISLSKPGTGLAQEMPFSSNSDLLSSEDREALNQGQEIRVIIELDQAEAMAIATKIREQAGISYDNLVTLAERTQIYRRHKAELMAALPAEATSVLRDYSHLPMLLLRLNSPAALQALLKHPGIKAVYSDTKDQPTLEQSLPLIHQPETAILGGIGAGTTVAVIDTGVDYTRNTFGSCSAPGGACKVIYAQDFAPDDGQLDDLSNHGSMAAGIVLGVAPGVRIAALDVYGDHNGQYGAFLSDVIAAINWSIQNKASYNIVAINLSLGSGRYYSLCSSDPYATPIANARAAGILTVAAAGNDGYKDSLNRPACVPGTVSVGAVYDYFDNSSISWLQAHCTDDSIRPDRIICFSDSASFLTLLAPGATITAAGISGSGTSMATPHVAGAIAVLRAAYPSESLNDTIARMTSTGVPLNDTNGIIKPRLDLLGAYQAISWPAPKKLKSDFNGDGKTDLAGLASNGQIFYSTNLATWHNTPGLLTRLVTGDFNNDGKTDLAGLASNGQIFYSTNLATWHNILGTLAQIDTGDFDGDGKTDLAGLTSNGRIFYSIDLITWRNIPGLLTGLVAGDFNGDGRDDLAGLASNGQIFYSTDLAT